MFVPRPRNFLVLSPHAFGWNGGIAQYNRDLIEALSRLPDCGLVLNVPRQSSGPGQAFPERVQEMTGSGSKTDFVSRAIRGAVRAAPVSAIVCTHVNLLPAALAIKALVRAPLCLVMYGIEVWAPVHRRAMDRVDHFVSISRFTADRFTEWSGVEDERMSVLPNAIRLGDYPPGAPSPACISTYREPGSKIILTLARLNTAERYKGIDEVIGVLGRLPPHVRYIVAGDGDDRARLQRSVCHLGLSTRVLFTGMVSEAERLDLYRLADAFVMPGRGEGFGFVYLEAMACGTPVVASMLDGSSEAVRYGQLGSVVDPSDPDALVDAIETALGRTKERPAGLHHFAFEHFVSRVAEVVRAVV